MNNNDSNKNLLINVDTTTASDIKSQFVSWLWPPSYIPIGTATLVFGEGGAGKSFFTLALAAAISKGGLLPGMDIPFPVSDVIIQNAENPWPTIIKPRLEMLGADCTKIHCINESDKRLTLTDERIEAAIRKHSARLVIIDPVQSHFPADFSMNRAESVRPMLMHLERVAERTQSAILLVGHVNKSNNKAQHRALGSVDIVNAVPSVLFLGRAEGLAPDVRAICHGKSNYSELSVTQLFRLNKKDGFQWIGESNDITPDDVMNFNAKKSKEDKNKIDEAVDFLTDLLSDGEIIPASEAIELADEMGISKRTLDRARKEINVKAKKADGHWQWSL